MSLSRPLLEGHPTPDPAKFKKRSYWLYLWQLWRAPLIVAVMVFVVAWVALLVSGPFVLDFGGDDRQDVPYIPQDGSGFFVPEKQSGQNFPPGYDNTYRWTGRPAYINLPWPLDAVPLKATLRATAARPDRAPDKPGTTLTITGSQGTSSQTIGKFEVKGIYEGSDIVFQLPSHLRPDLERFKLRFDSSETFQPGNGDNRRLSAIFFNLKLEPDYAAFGLKGWLATLLKPGVLALLTFCTWGFGTFLTRRQNWQLGLEIIGGALLVASLFWWPQVAELYYAPWLLILGMLWLMLWLAGRFVTSAPTLPAAFVYAACVLPLLPFMQFTAGRMDFKSFNPGSVSFELYFAALIVSTIAYLGRRKNFESVFMWVFLLASFLIFTYTHGYVYAQNLYRGADFRNYYISLLDMEQSHSPLYNLQQMADQPGQAVRQPPAFAVLFWPFARLFGRNIDMAIFGWRIFTDLLLLPTLYIFLKLFGYIKPGLKMWPAILFLIFNFRQLAETTAYGQQNNLLLFGLALGALWIKQNRNELSGIALSVPIWAKLLPAVTGAFFLIERRWRGLFGLAAGALLMNLLTLSIIGWDNLWFYFSKAMWSVNEPELGITNQSWWGFIGRLSVTEVKGDFAGGYPRQLVPVGYLGTFLGVVITLWVLWRARNSGWLNQQLMMGALILVGLWIPPFSWMHYIVQGLIAIVAIMAAISQKNASPAKLLVFALAYGFLAYGGRQEFFFTEAVGLERLGSSYRFLATFAMWLLNLWLLWPVPSSASPKPEAEKQTVILPATPETSVL